MYKRGTGTRRTRASTPHCGSAVNQPPRPLPSLPPLPNYCQTQLELTWKAKAKSKSRGKPLDNDFNPVGYAQSQFSPAAN